MNLGVFIFLHESPHSPLLFNALYQALHILYTPLNYRYTRMNLAVCFFISMRISVVISDAIATITGPEVVFVCVCSQKHAHERP